MNKNTPVSLITLGLFSATVYCFALPALAVGEKSPSNPPRATQWTIVATYPIPEGASGLAYDGSKLYCGIYGVNGGDVYQIDPSTGAYSLIFTGPQGDAFGLTYDGSYLWTTDHPGSSSAPAIAMKLDWDGTLLDQFNLPDHYMSGIGYDNGDFWVTRYYPDPGHAYKVNTSGTILNEFDASDNQPWDVCIGNGNLWIADYWGDTIYEHDPNTGALLSSHPSQGVDPAGVVWDGQYLWYCDNGEGGFDFLYKVDLAGAGTPQIDIPVTSYDFGPVATDASDTWLVTVQNNGTADLSISGVTFAPTNDLSTPDTFPIVIPPAGNDQLTIVFAPDDFAPLDATATVLSDDPVHPTVDLTLTGYGVYPVPTVGLLATSHNYGAVRADATTRWFMNITNQGATPLIVSDITIDDPAFYLDESVTFPFQVNTLASVDIGIWFNPDTAIPYSATASIYSNDPNQSPLDVPLSGSGVETQYPMGQQLWSFTITGNYDNSPKAIASIPDVSGDGVADVIVCSEDDIVRCFNGNSHNVGDVLWEHEIYAGSVYSQNGLAINEDVDGDGYNDVVVGAAWGGRLIRTISGKTGQTIWTHDTHEYGDGGWVYQVECSHDYNNDGVVDVLAATGDDSNDIGPKRVYCLNGLTGNSIFETPLGGPVFGVIGVEDFTGDGYPDVIAGASDEGETEGRVFGINSGEGLVEWMYVIDQTSVWALGQIDDITNDGIPDVIAGGFGISGGSIYGLDAANGNEKYSNPGYGGITRFVRLDDANGDGHPDFVPAHFEATARAINGQTGGLAWITSLVDKSASVAATGDLNDDGVGDVLVGTLFSTNHAYFLDGADGTVLDHFNYGTPVDAIGAIPDVVGDGSWEMVVGGRNGLVTCYSGGIGADCNGNGVPDWQDIANCAGDPACDDCNGNGLPDGCDIASGASPDTNGNSIPDECDCPGDLDGDFDVDLADLANLLAHYGQPGPLSYTDGDLDGDGDVDLADLAALLAAYGVPCS